MVWPVAKSESSPARNVNTVVNGETVAQLKRLDLPIWDVEKVIRRRKQLAVQRHLRIAEQYSSFNYI
mgnify:CR=1 FL=1